MSRARTVYVTCPFCKGMMEINTENGKIIRRFAPKEKSESGDALTDALKDVREGESRREKMFRAAKEEEKGKLDRIEKIFLKKKKEVEESGDISKPLRPIDL